MSLDRRSFASLIAGALGGSALPLRGWAGGQAAATDPCHPAPAVAALKPMLDGVVPISDAERRSRLEKAQRLMMANRIGAVLLEPGTSMTYFTGMGWDSRNAPSSRSSRRKESWRSSAPDSRRPGRANASGSRGMCGCGRRTRILTG